MYESVFRALAREKVRYLVVGGIAVNFYGIPRMTKDLDLMLDLGQENVLRFARAMKAIAYRPRAPVATEDLALEANRTAWLRDKGAVVFTLQDPKPPHLQVDVFLKNPLDFDQAYRNRKTVRGGGLSLSVVSSTDLIRLKKLANRAQDQADIAMLRKLQNESAED